MSNVRDIMPAIALRKIVAEFHRDVAEGDRRSFHEWLNAQGFFQELKREVKANEP